MRMSSTGSLLEKWYSVLLTLSRSWSRTGNRALLRLIWHLCVFKFPFPLHRCAVTSTAFPKVSFGERAPQVPQNLRLSHKTCVYQLLCSLSRVFWNRAVWMPNLPTSRWRWRKADWSSCRYRTTALAFGWVAGAHVFVRCTINTKCLHTLYLYFFLSHEVTIIQDQGLQKICACLLAGFMSLAQWYCIEIVIIL